MHGSDTLIGFCDIISGSTLIMLIDIAAIYASFTS